MCPDTLMGQGTTSDAGKPKKDQLYPNNFKIWNFAKELP